MVYFRRNIMGKMFGVEIDDVEEEVVEEAAEETVEEDDAEE